MKGRTGENSDNSGSQTRDAQEVNDTGDPKKINPKTAGLVLAN